MQPQTITPEAWKAAKRQGTAHVAADGATMVLRWEEGRGTCLVPVEIRHADVAEPLTGCDEDGCGAWFVLVPARRFPTKCLDHADLAARR